MIQAIYDGQAQLLQGVQPLDGIASVAPSVGAAQQFLNTLPQYDYNLAKAKAELAQSAYPHGFSVTIPYWIGQGFGQFTALSMQQTLRPLGIHVALKPLEAGPFLTQQISGAHRGLQIVRYPTYPQDPRAGIAHLYGVANKNVMNYSNFFSPATEAAWKQVRQSVDNSVRWQGVQTLMRVTADQLPYITLFNEPEFIVTKGITFANGSLQYPDLYNDQWVFKLR